MSLYKQAVDLTSKYELPSKCTAVCGPSTCSVAVPEPYCVAMAWWQVTSLKCSSYVKCRSRSSEQVGDATNGTRQLFLA